LNPAGGTGAAPGRFFASAHRQCAALRVAKRTGDAKMLKWALIMAVVALIAGALGFGGIAGAAAGIAKLLFGLFVIGFLVFLVLAIVGAKKLT